VYDSNVEWIYRIPFPGEVSPLPGFEITKVHKGF